MDVPGPGLASLVDVASWRQRMDPASGTTRVPASRGDAAPRLRAEGGAEGPDRLSGDHHYAIGTPAEDVDHTKTKIAATVAVAALKFAIKHFTRSSVHTYASLSGGSGTADAIARAVTPLQGLTDLLAVRYDAMRGDRLGVGLIGDALTTVGLVRRMEICHEVATALLPFGLKSNGQSGFAALPVLFYFDSVRYEAHRRLIADVGYRRSWVAGGWSFVHATICDVRRRLVESAPPKGLFSGMQKAIGLRPFNLQDLHEVLALVSSQT